jgi:hypothetical protein
MRSVGRKNGAHDRQRTQALGRAGRWRWQIVLIAAALAQFQLAAEAHAGNFAIPLAEAASPDAAAGHYWHPMAFGSESMFDPLSATLNMSFDILRNPSYGDRLTDISIRSGALNVLQNVSLPFDAVHHYGGDHFVEHEVFPIHGFSRQYGQFLPNWFMHTLGEGTVYRKLEDWYAYHHVDHPRVVAIATLTAIQFLNEIVENGSFRGPNQDPISDMLLWNPLGIVLFSFEPVARFFHGPVMLDYWPGQPVLTNGMRLENAAENYAFKIHLGLPYDIRGFFYMGKEGLGGATFPISKHDHLSIAGGASLNRLQEVRVGDGTGRILIPDGNLVLESALFWDRDESLMASLLVGITHQASFHLNVYPGLFEWNGLAFGGYARWAQTEGASAGISLRGSPIGLGWVQQANDHPAQSLY